MFDFSWSELLVVAAVAVVVIGPKELPAMMHTLGRVVRRLQYVRYAFSQQFEDFMAQHDLDGLHKSVNFEAGRNAVKLDDAPEDEEIEAERLLGEAESPGRGKAEE